jgi:hypothetical protein
LLLRVVEVVRGKLLLAAAVQEAIVLPFLVKLQVETHLRKLA